MIDINKLKYFMLRLCSNYYTNIYLASTKSTFEAWSFAISNTPISYLVIQKVLYSIPHYSYPIPRHSFGPLYKKTTLKTLLRPVLSELGIWPPPEYQLGPNFRLWDGVKLKLIECNVSLSMGQIQFLRPSNITLSIFLRRHYFISSYPIYPKMTVFTEVSRFCRFVLT